MNNGPLNNEFIAIFCVSALQCSIDSANLEVMIIIGTISSSRKRTNKNYQFLFITIVDRSGEPTTYSYKLCSTWKIILQI